MTLSYPEWLGFNIDILRRDNRKARRARAKEFAAAHPEWTARRAAARAKYEGSAKGQAIRSAYTASSHGKKTREAYRNSAAGQLAQFRADLNRRTREHDAQYAALGLTDPDLRSKDKTVREAAWDRAVEDIVDDAVAEFAGRGRLDAAK